MSISGVGIEGLLIPTYLPRISFTVVYITTANHLYTTTATPFESWSVYREMGMRLEGLVAPEVAGPWHSLDAAPPSIVPP